MESDEDKTTPRSILLQHVTMGLSIAFQIAAFAVTLYAFRQSDTLPKPLVLILYLEVSVQAVEILWYTGTFLWWIVRKQTVVIGYRYIDWVFSTPVMLVSTLYFLSWLGDRECDEVVLNTSYRVALLFLLPFLDWAMLFFGAIYEIEATWTEKLRNSIDYYDGQSIGIRYGFVVFLVIFSLLLPVTVSSPSYEGTAVWLITFFLWALYGVVALWGQHPFNKGPRLLDDRKSNDQTDKASDSDKQIREALRNASYNILDVLSKNIAGFAVGYLILQESPTTPDPPVCLHT
tara:strand:- start:4050 stop:4916 length:867 start_codon:yes stop_codon:yes gene_type:complete